MATHFDELPDAEKAAAKSLRRVELAAISARAYPCEALWDRTRVTVLGPITRFPPYVCEQEDPSQLLAEGSPFSGGRSVILAGSVSDLDGRPWLTPWPLPPRPFKWPTSKNPPLGVPWLTPRLEARLSDLERRHINRRTRAYGREHGERVCQTAPQEAIDLVIDASGDDYAMLESGTVHGVVHWWIRMLDGTVVDVAATQFGQRSPLVVPPGHPLQRLYRADRQQDADGRIFELRTP